MASQEDLIQKYRQDCNITEDFFCKYDPDQEYSMTFKEIPYSEGYVRPCCEKVAQRDQFEQQRHVLLQQLYQVRDRIDMFQKLLEEVKTNPTNFDFTKVEGYFQEEGPQLGQIANEIQRHFQVCFEEIYAEEMVTLTMLPSLVCEPIEVAVKNIQSAFFPWMFRLEEHIAEARLAQQNTGGILARTMAFFRNVYQKVAGVVQTIKLAINYVYTYALQNFRRFVRASFQNAEFLLQNVCTYKEDKQVTNMYLSMYKFIARNMQAPNMPDEFKDTPFQEELFSEQKRLVATVRNRFQIFCNRREHKLLIFVVETAAALLKNEESILKSTASALEVDEVQNKFTEFKTHLQRIDADIRTMLKRTCVFGETRVTVVQCVDWLWVICIYGFELFRNIVGYAKTVACDYVKPFLTRIAKNQTDLQSTEAIAEYNPKTVPQTVEEFNDKLDLQQIARLPFPSRMWNEQKQTIVETTKSQKEIARLVDLLFQFFWFFTKSNFVPKEDVEANLEQYINQTPLTVEQEMKKVQQAHKPVPEYVRRAYCLAQKNSPADCDMLVSQNKPIMGLANARERYATYIAQEKLRVKEKTSEKAADDLTEPEIRERILQSISKNVEQEQRDAKTIQAIQEARQRLGLPQATFE